MEKTWTITITVSKAKEDRIFFECFVDFMMGLWKFLGAEAVVLLDETEEK